MCLYISFLWPIIYVQYDLKCFLSKNTECLLYRLQKKQNSNFDGTNFTDQMEEIFQDIYQLPILVKRYEGDTNKTKNYSEQPYDELFIWSLLLYSGDEKDLKLSYHFWSKTKYPIACCMVGIILYKNLLGKNYIPDDLKENMETVVR